MKRQHGTTTVEFAIVATAAFLILFGVIEISRALFVWNSLTEVTRRGARVAVVCPRDHSAIAQIAMFNAPGSADTSPVVTRMTTDNIRVSYLDENGAAAGDYPSTYFVRVEIVDFQHQLLIPLLPITLDVPGFRTTLRAESLGYVPETGARECYGTTA
jgi:hypothetical protein